MRRFLGLFAKGIGLCVALLLGVVGVYLAAALLGAVIPSGPKQAAASSTVKDERIYLATSLLHADIVIPVDETVRERFAFLRQSGFPLDHPALRFLVFGWGGRDFYIRTPTLSAIRPGPVLKGVFGDRSVMHVLAAAQVEGITGTLSVDLPPGGRERLLDFIAASFSTDAEGQPVHLPGTAYGPADAFFEGIGNFNILRPCNVWVAEGLRRAGLTTGLWTPTTFALRLGLQWHNPAAIVSGSSAISK